MYSPTHQTEKNNEGKKHSKALRTSEGAKQIIQNIFLKILLK